ncbi:MAG: YdeI/OmpD-associated family protein [Terracoccus sp.]
MKFRAEVELGGKTATGIVLPDEVVTAMGAGRRPAVLVTVGGHSYRTTVASMGGRFLVPLSADNRGAAGVAAGDTVEVEITLDTAPREVTVPADLAQALAEDPTAGAFFDGLAPSHRKEWVRWVEEAKRAQTRASRLAKTLAALQAGQRDR